MEKEHIHFGSQKSSYHTKLSYSIHFHSQGKGEMETYWLEEGPGGDFNARSRSCSGIKSKLKNIFN